MRIFIRKLTVLLVIISVMFSIAGKDSITYGARTAKPKLLKKTTVTVSQSKTLTIKNVKKSKIKKTSWKVNNKKKLRLSGRKKNKARITGLRAGKVKVTATVKMKGKKYKLRTTVQVRKKGWDSKDKVPKGTNSPLPEMTDTPTITPEVTPTFMPEATPEVTPKASPEATPEVTPKASPETTPEVTPKASPEVTPEATPKASPEVSSSPQPTETPVVSGDFDDGDMGDFKGRGNAAVEISDDGYEGKCLVAKGRTDAWHGIQVDVNNLVQEGNTYSFSAFGKSTGTLKLTMAVKIGSGQESYIEISQKVSDGDWVELTGSYTIPVGVTSLLLYLETTGDKNTDDIYLDNLKMVLTAGAVPTGNPTERPAGSLKDSFAPIFGKVGTAVSISQMSNTTDMNFIKSQYNSVTLENEMKPDSILGTTTRGTLPDGYIENITYEYKDTVYPVLNLDKIERAIDLAYRAGLKMRYHVLVWHAQTPTRFFRENYSNNGAHVDAETMNGRMEYYIRNIMHYVYNTEHGKDVIYSWDVVNEYTHNNNGNDKCDWDKVYYPEYTFSTTRHSGIYDACYVNDAFKIADDQLNKLEQEGKIPDADDIGLFYNDFNEYIPDTTAAIIELIDNINKNGKICDGIGMQMHLDVGYPSAATIAEAIDKFQARGYKMQMTEIDVTNYPGSNRPESQQTQYWSDLFRMIVAKKSSGADIDGITFWGLYDTISWRRDGVPLLFSGLNVPRDSFYEVLAAAKGYNGI